MIKAAALQRGATIGIIAPASPLRSEERLQKGISYLEGLGYRVELGKHLFEASHYLSASDEGRLDDLVSMFTNPKIDAIFCTRGGYGSMRFLERIPYAKLRRHPKIFVTFSDGTALNAGLYRHAKLITFSGAMVSVDFPDFDAESEEFFWRILSSKKKIGTVHQSLPLKSLRKGSAKGKLLCGNLSLFSALCGTRFFPDTRDALLLMEDIGEESYKVDRLLSQLELSAALAKSSGLLFGQFTQDAQRKTATPSRNILDVCQEYSDRVERCAVANVMFGHTPKKLTLPFGIQASLKCPDPNSDQAVRFSLDEAAVV